MRRARESGKIEWMRLKKEEWGLAGEEKGV